MQNGKEWKEKSTRQAQAWCTQRNILGYRSVGVEIIKFSNGKFSQQ